MAGGFKPNNMLTGLCVNAAWGVGTGILLALYRRSRRQESARPSVFTKRGE
jgi:hypothetical protein